MTNEQPQENILKEWCEETGAIHPKSSVFYELLSMFEDAETRVREEERKRACHLLEALKVQEKDLVMFHSVKEYYHTFIKSELHNAQIDYLQKQILNPKLNEQ